jgi:hypothetical protein
LQKGKSKNSFDEEFDDDDGIAMFAKNFRKLMNSKRFKNRKFSDNFKGDPKGAEQEKGETDKKDCHGSKCFECLGIGHIRADCGNLKQAKGKGFNATLSDDS